MKYISLFSGIECASLAAKPLGWTPVAFAEIEPFPAKVLEHHYPEVPNLGDVTAVNWAGWNYDGTVDLVIGGSPCQAFSVAGRRESLGDARGNLTLAFVEAVNDIDPTFVVWENVPGVLSTRDNAFGHFLAALAGHDRPLHTPDGRGWPAAGVAVGPRRRLAWRVLDAQYFGVPQRRRRVFLVGCPRTSGFDPAEILFEREGVCRDSAPRREAGKITAPTVTGRAPFNGTGNARVECEALVIGAVTSKWAKGTGGPAGDECQNLVVGTLSAKNSIDGIGRESLMIPVMAFHGAQDPDVSGDVTHPVGRNQGQETCIAFTERSRPAGRTLECQSGCAYALTNPGSGGRTHSRQIMDGAAGVRRLTPRECERLQGLPDDYTLVPYRGKPAADGPRYKAIGNGMAVPVVAWILMRIDRAFTATGAAVWRR